MINRAAKPDLEDRPHVGGAPAMLTVLVPCLLLTVLQLMRFRSPTTAQDDAQLIVYPELLAHGWVPWSDFETLYGTLHLWALRGIYGIFGWSVVTMRAAGLVFGFVFLYGIVAVARRYGSEQGALLGGMAAACVVGTVPPRPSAWVLSAGMGLSAIASRRDETSGLLAGAAVACRPDLALLALMSFRRSPRWAFGAAIGASPMLVYVVLTGPVAVVEGTVLNGLRSGPYRRLTLAQGDVTFTLVMLGVAVAVMTLGRQHRPLWGVVPVLVVYGLQRIDPAHLLRSSAVFIGVLPGLLLARRLPAASAVAAAVLPILAVPFLRDSMLDPSPPRSYEIQVGDRVWWQGESTDDLERLAVAVAATTHPGDRLFVGPAPLSEANYNDLFLYHLFPDLDPTGPWLEFNPDNANREGSGLDRQVASADVVILTHRYLEGWMGPRSFGSDAPSEALRRGFQSADRFGPWELFVRRPD